MTSSTINPSGGLSGDFWRFLAGQLTSNLGSSLTTFALPLLAYQLTGSAINLAITSAATFLPYLLFGLVIGAWVDRLNRKYVMIFTSLGSTVMLLIIPLLDWNGMLRVEWLYIAAFINTTLAIGSDTAEFAVVPLLVSSDDLVTANGRIQASYAAAQVLGPLLAGVLTSVLPLSGLMLLDAATFVAAAVLIATVRRDLRGAPGASRSVRSDIVAGLRYVIGHPVLRNISIMMALVNLFANGMNAQLVLFAKEQLRASDAEVGVFFAAGSLGVVLLALLAGPIRRRLSFSKAALGALTVSGLLSIGLALTANYWLATVLWAFISGFGTLFNINTGSLRQALVPNDMLGRVLSIATVIAWSAIPLGALAGGFAIERFGIMPVFLIISGIITLIPLFFAFSPLGRAEQYLPQPQ
jgi:MFS family permease